jgi:hypothetical protein
VLIPRLRSPALLGLLAAAFALADPAPARAFSPYLVVPDPAVAEASPAYRYANMSDDEAMAELDRRKILYTRLDATAGVRAPVRLTGRLHGVNIHSSLPPEQRVVSMFEILDARLALALDDFAAVLERHDIDEVIHYTMYRPNVAPAAHGAEEDPEASRPAGRARASHAAGKPSAPSVQAPMTRAPIPAKPQASLGGKGTLEGTKGRRALPGLKQKGPAPLVAKPEQIITGKPAGKAVAAPLAKGKGAAPAPAAKPVAGTKRPVGPVARREPSGLHQTTWASPGTRHPAGLAIDVGLLHKRDGRWLSVARHFRGHIGDKTCGDGAPVPEDPDARELRALVCESADLGVFTYVLTPDYNAAHADHFHMEVRPGVRWFLYH